MKLKGWSATLAAKVLGINEVYLRSLLSLVEAPKEVKLPLQKGQLFF
jgi:hypothetical protein